ncbi:MAG: NAD-dependent epimerase/dehydratase family protein, partial [Bacteroidales bacterium]|nr:NAD-dependent epimerase/dehydratase family protein [Bacteroidales bacterium]
LVKGNVLDSNSLKKLCDGADIVFHLAAIVSIDNRDRDKIFKVNVQGTRNIIDACIKKKVKRLIHFSSIHTLSHQPLDQVLDESRPMLEKTKLAYEQSKIEGEKLVHEAVAKGLDAVIILPSAIVGPYDYKSSLMGHALIKIYQNKLPMLIAGGYDFVDVRDVVDGAINASIEGRKGNKYILSGQFIELKDLSDLIGQLTGQKTPKFIAPTFLAKIGLPFISLYSSIMKEHPLYTGETLDILLSSNRNISYNKARKELNYQPHPIEKTLVDTFDWYKQNGMIL